MTETVPPTLSSQTTPSWRSPILIAAVLLSVFVLGGATFMLLTKNNRLLTERQTSSDGLIVSPMGIPVDEKKTVSNINRLLSDDQENEFLTFSYLRNTYSGGLLEVVDTAATAVNDTDVAVTLEISKGDAVPSLFFEITKAELETLRVHSVGQSGTGPITYQELERGDALSITRVTDLVSGGSNPDEIIIEATKQSI